MCAVYSLPPATSSSKLIRLLIPFRSQMAVLVEAQDVQIVAIEQNAVETNRDMEKGLEHTQAAVVSARNSRKMRWWCFG